jgi:nucleotide-binding universal stress UspA family protein
MVTLAAALTGRDGGLLYALRLVPPNDRSSFVLTQRSASQETTALTPLLERARELDVDVHALAFVSSVPADDICNVAAVKSADLVLMGWHKPLIGRTVLGGTVRDVMRHAPSDVGVFVDRGLERIERVLVPYLGGHHDHGALSLAARLARTAGAEVTVLGVLPPTAAPAIRERLVAEIAAEFRGAPWNAATQLVLVEDADPAEAALRESEASDRRYDLVLIGAGAEWGLAHRPFGVHAEEIIARSTTSLLIVRQLEVATQRAVLAPAVPFETTGVARG